MNKCGTLIIQRTKITRQILLTETGDMDDLNLPMPIDDKYNKGKTEMTVKAEFSAAVASAVIYAAGLPSDDSVYKRRAHYLQLQTNKMKADKV